MTKRTAVILAGSDGLGFASAQCLGDGGRRVVLFSRSEEKLEKAKGKLAERGIEAHAVSGDLRSPVDVDRLFSFVEGRFGGTDILVNNSGGPRPGTLLELEEADWMNAFEEQALSLIFGIKRVVPRMRAQKWGRIITIASISVKSPIESLDLSNFMRCGLASVHRTLARELAKDDVNVHMVLPGSIMTERTRFLVQSRAEKTKISFEDALAGSMAKIPKGRLGKPEDVGNVVAFLASEQADYLTGNFIRVDGGTYAGYD